MDTVDLNAAIDIKTGCRPIIPQMVAKTHIFNANLQNTVTVRL